MARTKQTSGKSTGGPAKRGELPPGSFKCVTGRGGQKIIKSVNAKALPTGLDTIQSATEGTLKPQVWNLVSAPNSLLCTSLIFKSGVCCVVMVLQ
jgi:hypothetical protein